MRAVLMLTFLLLAMLVSGCNDSSKLDELTKANTELTEKLRICIESKQTSSAQEELAKKQLEKIKLQEEQNKRDKESLDRVKKEFESMPKTKF